MSHRFAVSLLVLACGLVLSAVRPAPGQPRPKAPPPPATFDIDVRYSIVAGRNQRARALLALKHDLKTLDFKRHADDEVAGEDQNEIENVAVTHLRGTIPAANARKILRNPSVRTILLTPTGVKLLADKAVRVELDLAAHLQPTAQRILAAELLAVLRELGFREAVGYDHRNFTRLVGGLPASQIPTLLNDVRLSPVAWKLLPKTLLTNLRRFEGGRAVLEATLLEWSRHPVGKGLVADMVADWGLQKPALDYLSKLPLQVRRNEDVVQDLLLAQVQQHPEGTPFLTKLLATVFKSKAARELVEELLTGLEGRVAGAALPRLFRGSTVLRTIEARPDYPLPAPRPPRVLVPDVQEKLAPHLRAVLVDTGLRRLEVILTEAPTGAGEWNRELHRVVPTLTIEGRAGEVVTVRCKPADALKLAALEDVSTIRLPRPAESALLVLPDEQGDPAKVLTAAGLDRLHRAGRRGQGVSVAVVDADFRGWRGLVGKQLPKTTRYLDLTAERNDDLQPDPFPAGEGLGSGVRLARAVLLAAPSCNLTLVRIDPAAPYLLNLLLHRLNGDALVNESLVQRRDDLTSQRRFLSNRRAVLNKEREAVFRLFADDRPQNDPMLKKRQERRDAYFKAQEKFDEDERQYDALVKRYLDYRAALRELRNIRVVVCGLGWNDGLPTDGTGPLSRYLDDSPLRALWFQPAGNTRGQAWTGLYRDANGDGVMEFAPSEAPLPAGNWNHEINFLAWQPWKGDRTAVPPAGTKLRVSVQWQEAHAAEYARPGEDPYRKPLADLRLVVLRQPDPAGAKRPTDDLVMVTESVGLPQRLVNRPSGSTYEQVVEFTADGVSRYGLRLEGLLPQGTLPPGAATLPLTRRVGEIRPRLFVESTAAVGRPVMSGYVTDVGTVGVPGDALRALTVGAVGASGKGQPYSTEGPPYNAELAAKPDVRFPDRLGLQGMRNVGGTALSAAFAAGAAAVRLSGGALPERIRLELRLRARRRPRMPRGD